MTHQPQPAFKACWTRTQLRVLVMACALFVADGIDNQILAVTIPALALAWARPSTDFTLALAAGYVGAALGAIVDGLLADRFGRKPVVVGSAMIFGFGTIAMVSASQPAHLIPLRFFTGFGYGGCLPVLLTLLTECVPPHRKGWVTALSLVCVPIGIATAGFLAAMILPLCGWRILFVGVGLLPLGIALLMLWLLPESPNYLACFTHRKADLDRLIAALGMGPGLPVSGRREAPAGAAFADALAPGLRTTVAGLFGAFFCNFLSISLVLAWLPTLLSNEGFSLNAASISPTVWSIAGIVGMLVAGWMIGRWGARPVANVVMVCGIASAALLALAAPAAASGVIMLGYFVLLAATGCMVNAAMTSLYSCAMDVFSPEIRATSLGFLTTAGRAGAVCGALLGGHFFTLNGLSGFFFILAGFLLLVFFFINLHIFIRNGAGGRIRQSSS